MSNAATPQRSKVPWALAVTVGLCSGLAGYVIHAARVNRIPKQVVTVTRLTDMPGSEETPAISPDGTKVAFVAAVDGKRQIWVQRLPSGTSQAITKDEADHISPRWAPDSGNLIYFSAGAIWEIPVRGGDARKLVDAVTPGDVSHDGKSLAFFRLQDRDIDLVTTASDGSNMRNIGKWSHGAFSNLRWSPDDKRIAYLENDNIHTKVMVITFSGGEAVQATGDEEVIQGFAWVPDNSGLIVSKTGSNRGELWFVPRAEGRPSSQLTFGELSYESPDVDQAGALVVSRRGLSGQSSDSDIVMFTGLKW